MKTNNFLKILLLILILLLNTENIIKAEQNFNKMRKMLFDKWMKWINETHPGKAVKLELQYSFPFEKEIEENEIFLKRAMTISKDTSGNIYIPDFSLHKIYKFSRDGHFLKKFGGKGQGPGEFQQPIKVFPTDHSIIVNEVGNRRIQFLDSNGNYKRSFKLFKTYLGMIERGQNGCFYSVPMSRYDFESKLIDVLSEEGELLYSFGECLKLQDRYLSDFIYNNLVQLCIGNNSVIYIAFQFFPLIREYSPQGKLLKEFRVKHTVMDMQEKINLSRLNRSKKSQSPSARVIIIPSIKAFNGRIYLLRTAPCLEILEIQSNGLISKIYYWEKSLNYFSQDFLINERNGEKLFYVLNYIDQRVDIFK